MQAGHRPGRAGCMDGDCVLLLSHKGTSMREPEPFNGAFRGTHRTTFCFIFLSTLLRYTCIIWTAGCSWVQCGFELELIRALMWTRWANRCAPNSQITAGFKTLLRARFCKQAQLAAKGHVPHCWLSPRGSTLSQKQGGHWHTICILK